MNADETGMLVREVSNVLKGTIIFDERVSWITDIIMAASFDDKDQAQRLLDAIQDEIDNWR